MNPSFLHRLEQAFAEACELNDHGSQAAYCRRIAEEDAALADELRMMLAIRTEAEELFASKRDQFSLLLTSLGDTKRAESGQELLDFLGGISESQNEDEITTIRGFSLRELVAIGATGFVFRGVDKRLQRDVAVKVLAPSIARDPVRRQAFTKEARLASTVRHPNVVSIHQVSDEPDSTLVFFVMDWVSGVLLQDLVTSSPPNQEQCQGLLSQIADGVDAIHAKGIVHRDLKPGNIIVGERSHVTILDFGLAREQDLNDAATSTAGTPLYMSPEQLLGENLTHRSDLFSLTEIACVLLTGKHPYPATSITELSEVVLGGSPRIETDNTELASALAKGMSFDPMQRYESGGELVEQCLTLPSTAQNAAINPPGKASTEAYKGSSLVATWLFAFAATVTVLMALILGWPNSNEDPLTPANTEQTRSGEWIDEDRYRNYAGIEFIRIEGSASKIDSWPPVPDHPELFEDLGAWAHTVVDAFVSRRLVTRAQYLQVMGQLPAGVPEDPNELDAPVTMVSYHDATRFCERLSDADPDNNRYQICDADRWALAVYGSQLLDGKASAAEIMSTFKRYSRGDKPDSTTKAIPLIGDVLGNYWEWSWHKYRKPTTLEGIVSYSTLPEEMSEPIQQVLGGGTKDIFLHAHDMRSGMNDHYHSSHNLTFRTEKDGQTSYLYPSQANQRGYLRYRYHTIAPIIEARLLVPFRLFNAKASAGIRVRSASQNKQDLASSEWHDVYSRHNEEINKIAIDREFIDLTPYVADASEVEVEYWLTTDDSVPLHHTQLGRTSPYMTIPFVFCFEATTLGRNESPRQFVPLPASYKSEHVGFRIKIVEKAE